MWAHATPLRPERGGLLLATPKTAAAMGGEEYCECVVLLVQHSAGGGGGSMGLILNRPTGMVLGRRRGGLPFEVSGAPPNMQAVFSDNRVYCGGFVAQQVLHVLHGHALPRAVEVVPGVFVGGEAAAVDAATAGQLDPSGFKFYSGAVVWEAGDLEAQVKAGVWLTAAASRSLILKPCLQLPTPLWTEVLMLMGGEAAQMAKDAWEGDE